MKALVVTLAIFLALATAGTVSYLHCHKPPPPVAPEAEPQPPPTEQTPPDTTSPAEHTSPQTDSANAIEPPPVPATRSIPSELKPETSPTLSQAVDTLISREISFSDRRALWQKLKEAGQLDQVIAELRQRAADNPNDAEIPTALGVGLMNKFPVQDFTEAATLGLQIDQSFDAALKLEPANWEAQYEKANSMSYWPDGAGNKRPEIIQRLSALIDQQEMMTQQPEFAKPYVLLGRQYQKAGHADLAEATWQKGLARFPNDSALQKETKALLHR